MPDNLRYLTKLGKSKEFIEMLEMDGQMLSRPRKRKTLTAMRHNCKKSTVKHSVERPMLFYFVGLSTTF